MIITFEGGSDDSVYTAIGPSIAKLKRNQVYTKNAGELAVRSFTVATPGRTNGVYVTVLYGSGPGPTWAIAYGQLDENRWLPNWTFTLELAACGYSTRLVIDTGDDLVELIALGKDSD